MSTRLNPYLNFPGTTRQAMEFYHDVLGGDLMINTFGEYGSDDPATKDNIMHATLETPGGLTLMASDLAPGMEHKPGENISITSAVMTPTSCAATGRSCPWAEPSPCRWRSRYGVTSSGCVPTGMASAGWSTSASGSEPAYAATRPGHRAAALAPGAGWWCARAATRSRW